MLNKMPRYGLDESRAKPVNVMVMIGCRSNSIWTGRTLQKGELASGNLCIFLVILPEYIYDACVAFAFCGL